MELESLEPDRVEEVFSRHGALAVTLSDAGDEPALEPAPGETPLWRRTSVTGLFEEHQDLDALKSDLIATFDIPRLPACRVDALDDRDWEREWLRDFGPMRFGHRLWVGPHGAQIDAPDAVVVRLDPGLAFGTGTHPTTALCLEWLDSTELENASMLDFGCGSGILAIAALLLGAASATAVDIDAQAIVAARRNAIANGVAARLTLGSDAPAHRYDVVVANILAQPLVDLAPVLTARLHPGGAIALSGILEHQADAVVRAYRDRIAFGEPLLRDGWALLTGETH